MLLYWLKKKKKRGWKCLTDLPRARQLEGEASANWVSLCSQVSIPAVWQWCLELANNTDPRRTFGYQMLLIRTTVQGQVLKPCPAYVPKHTLTYGFWPPRVTEQSLPCLLT